MFDRDKMMEFMRNYAGSEEMMKRMERCISMMETSDKADDPSGKAATGTGPSCCPDMASMMSCCSRMTEKDPKNSDNG